MVRQLEENYDDKWRVTFWINDNDDTYAFEEDVIVYAKGESDAVETALDKFLDKHPELGPSNINRYFAEIAEDDIYESKRIVKEDRFDTWDDLTHDLFNAIAKVMFKYRNRDITSEDFREAMDFVVDKFDDVSDEYGLIGQKESVRRIKESNEERHWLNTELDAYFSWNLKKFLRDNKIKFETSAADNLTHFEVYVTEEEANMINDFIDSIDMNKPSTPYEEGCHSKKRTKKRRTVKESAWVSPDGTKYGKQKRGSGYDYRFSTRELKDMISKGIAKEIKDTDKAFKLKDEIIGISWNETNGYTSGALFKGKDGNLYVVLSGVASAIV